MASTDARPVPIKNTAYRVTFPILDADGDLVTGATGLDSEVSKDGGTFADCTNEATEIATSSGMYYLDLTSTEMNADCVAVIVKTSSSGAKTTPLVFYPQESGDIKVDVQSYGGTAGTFSGGRPEVNTTHAAGTAWGSGAITAGSIASDAITAAKIADGAIDLATFAADAKALMGVIAFGTLQAVTNTTAQLASGETFADDELIGATILFRTATTGAGQSRVITDSVGATDTVTFDALTTTPTGTITYVIFATSPASTSAPIAANVTQFNGVAATSASGIPEVKVASIAANAITATSIASDAITDAKVASDVTIASVTGAVGSVTGNVGGNVTGSVGSVVGAVGSVTGNVGGNVVGSVGSVTTVSDKTGYRLSATGVDDIWDEATSGHTTAGTTGKALTDAGSAGDPWSTAVPGAYAAGTAGYLIGTYVDAPISTVDTVVDAIKAKTDSLTFTVAGKVDSNIKAVNNVTVTGTGAVGDEWGP